MPQDMAQLKTLYYLAVNDREVERKQVAAYLNDTAVQALSALHIHFSLLPTTPNAQLRREVAQALPLLVELIAGLTHLARELRPLELDSFGLHEALQLAAESFTRPGLLTVRYEGSSVPGLPSAVATALYRLAQAALLAMQNHSQASEGLLRLIAENRGVCLTIHHNGEAQGSSGCAARPGSELLGLMVHFEQLNGRITHQFQPGVGTTITAVWPWSDAALQDSPGCDPVQDQPG